MCFPLQGAIIILIPEKVVKRIVDLSFVEMGDLMPEVWMRKKRNVPLL